MVGNLNKEINNIYEKNNLWKLSVKIILPSLLISLLLGVYIFVDQMLLIHLVPKDGNDYLYNYFLKNNEINLFEKVSNWLNRSVNIDGFVPVVSANNKDFIVYCANQVGVFSLIVLSFGYLISAGISILFGKNIAQKNDGKINVILSTGFYSSLILGIIFTVIMLLIQNYIIEFMLPSSDSLIEVGGDPLYAPTLEELKKYFDIYYSSVILETSKYIYFINSGILFSCLINLFVFFLITEGKNIVPTIISIVCNIMNIIFDLIFIKVIKMGIMGGGLSTFIGQTINLISLITYLFYLNRKQVTFILFSKIIKFNFDIKTILVSISLGSSTFLRELTLAIANIVYVQVFVTTIGMINNGALNSLVKISVSPIYNLFFFVIFGIIDGMRPILTYNYSINRLDRVKKTFFIGTLFSLIYSLVVIILVFLIIPTNNIILNFFNATSKYDKENMIILLSSMMFQFPFIALSIGGLALFQSLNKKIINFFLSIAQGVITFYPILFLNSYISLQVNSYKLMVFTGLINIFFSSLLIFSFSLFYIFKKLNNEINIKKKEHIFDK